jgi:1-deoxy-D-xylulose-5-phosphate synthase
MAPSNENECYAMLEAGYNYSGPAAVRYPRSAGTGEYNLEKFKPIEIGKAKIVREGKNIAILAFGDMLNKSKKAAEKLDATLVDMRFVKPLDEELLKKLSDSHAYFITVEDNVIAGGAGGAVNEFVLQNKIKVSVKNIGLPDKILSHGAREEILAEAGLDKDGILNSIVSFI